MVSYLNGIKACTLGPLIHNPIFVKQLESNGVYPAKDLTEVKEDHTLMIRTHGITKQLFEEIDSSGMAYYDATCPFVKKIHSIVAERSATGDIILIAGDKNHPEVIGIRSYCSTHSFVFSSA